MHICLQTLPSPVSHIFTFPLKWNHRLTRSEFVFRTERPQSHRPVEPEEAEVEEVEYTWQHRQPSRVVSIADRVPCQTSVLARILKRHIGQEQNLKLLICSVYTSRLWRTRKEWDGEEKDHELKAPQEETTNTPWRKRAARAGQDWRTWSTGLKGKHQHLENNQAALSPSWGKDWINQKDTGDMEGLKCEKITFLLRIRWNIQPK